MKNNSEHTPVLLREIVDFLHIKNQGSYIDATLGAGGHTIEICKRGGKVLGIDADSDMLKVARKRLKTACPGVFTTQGNFRNIYKIAKSEGFSGVDGILFDLGISTLHLKDFKRGFSFTEEDSSLDMRLDPNSQNVTGADLLNTLRQDQLVELFKEGMNEASARKLSKEIVRQRGIKKIEKVADFLKVIGRIPREGFKTNPATKPFMALRIAVNSELDSLREGLMEAFLLLKTGGRIAVITFHSGEDRVVKEYFTKWEKELKGKVITERPVVPTEEEVGENRKARSAKLRVFEKNEK